MSKRATFDYREVPEWIRIVRRSPVGAPFITFSYKALPRALEAAIAVRDPKKFLNFWKYPLAMGAVNEYAARKFGLRGEDGFLKTAKRVMMNGLGFGGEDLFKQLLPDHVGSNQVLVPYKDHFGRLNFWDATYTLPLGDLTEAGTGPIGKQLAKAGIPLPRQFEPSNPWLQTFLMGVAGYDLFRNKSLDETTKEPADIFGTRMKSKPRAAAAPDRTRSSS